ncbi:HAMP domain-containing histidine kinase [Romeria aff. gracilis LEGE 07310]|uniref:histidine kinase n=1 Tax=Vasconcelosia minhoensis LEGE 07310 TaxID=915328 RepID=A0A8J7DQD9_9CYAN|nr:HAMP domain-containing sensor histidine kinase [Romeria gracilis]MBE9076399.1 HAMP domain-containing histidine kinase [Romeria aff. gracilis LEGE 07310]
MDTNFVTLLIGVATGLGISYILRRPTAEKIEPAQPEVAPPAIAPPSPPPSLAYQRLADLERFKSGYLARTAHELRSPINSLISLHQLILEDLCEGPEEEREFIAQGKDTALKVLALFDTIMAVSKLDIGREQPQLEPVPLAPMLAEVKTLTEHQAANRSLHLTIEQPDESKTGESKIVTDPAWLKTLLVSLVQDAIANSAENTLRLWVEPLDDGVGICLERDRTAAQLQNELAEVADGTLKEVERTAAPVQLSTGLVLATAQLALEYLNGQLEILPHSAENHSIVRCRFDTSTDR